jgi:hypothetical protein
VLGRRGRQHGWRGTRRGRDVEIFSSLTRLELAPRNRIIGQSRTRRDVSLTVLVNSDRFERACAEPAKWEKEGKKYGVFFNDCVGYVDAVARATGLSVPEQNFVA